MWAKLEKKRRGWKTESPAGGVVKDGAEIAAGLKCGLYTEKTRQSGGRNLSGINGTCSKENGGDDRRGKLATGTEYISKMDTILGDPLTFTPISIDDQNAATTSFKKEINSLLRKKIISSEECKNFLSKILSKAYIYGLPKLHKEGIPLRPIIAYHLSPAAPLATYLAKILAPMLRDSNSPTSISSIPVFIVRGCIPNVDCGIRRSYLGPKQRLSVVQNVLRRPRRCERRRAYGRPGTSTTDEQIYEVEKMILANRRITVREVGSCHSIFINDLGMRRVAAKFVPKLLNCDQKQHRMNIANEMLDSVRDDPNLLQRVITGDEAWVYGYDVETKAQSSQWKLPHEPRPKKASQVRSNVKDLLTVFFDCRGVVHHEFMPQGRTVNKEYYLLVMRNLRKAIRQKRPDLWKNKNWLLRHDNAPAHTSLLVRDFLAKNNTLMMPQPPYSPDLDPCDFFLFPKLKRSMKGRRYATLDEIKTASKEELKIFLKNDFMKCFEDWKNPWHKCIISHGDYSEGDKIGMNK
ncbi:hypothetical protein LAZ67_12001710 [Cordylochernes scorpioides]|uniref:Transposase n=1 Tax=Cordylochernes scorpioides TaxID=51811 RepID=A0ABY6L3P7_9ARAC|nr:hypothetical protein LAZ67_12001710 [Cordylochernes scorpioides]